MLADNVRLLATLTLPDRANYLYQHLLDHRQIVDIKTFNPVVMNIFTSDVLANIRSGMPGWEKMMLVKVAEMAKEKRLFI